MKDKSEHKTPYNKVSVCIYPYKRGCKGCKYNNVPELFDGGCKLIGNNHAEAPRSALK